jgi:hypothetical protein
VHLIRRSRAVFTSWSRCFRTGTRRP